MTNADLMKKYDVPAPRYTSYPTVPYWETSPTTAQWIAALNEAFNDVSTNWALYLHIPYCETLCTFCGCNTSITKDHNKEKPYIDLLHREFETYTAAVAGLLERPLEELHLGGGTPTFLSPVHLKELLEPLLKKVRISEKGFEGSIEVDPRRTTEDHLKALRDVGFTRVSMGVQDFNPEVQRLVNRHQPFEKTRDLTAAARRLGFQSVNFDLIYGLPKQTVESVTETIRKTIELRPDRIALYAYAHVPWIKPAQRLFTEDDLPSGAAKRELYEIARDFLLGAGYAEIGMDHFALKTDALYLADVGGTLHRNFMGYTSRRTRVLLGLGVSAISEAPTCFHQNEKVLPVFERRVKAGEIPTLRGHLLTEEDRAAREQILSLMTRWEAKIESGRLDSLKLALKQMIDDGLVEFSGDILRVTAGGRPFLRNACMALDRRLMAKAPATKIFSQAL